MSCWEATTQVCSCCRFPGGKLDLKVGEWECLGCGAKHDQDENAAINILVAPWTCLRRRSCKLRRLKTDVEGSIRLPPRKQHPVLAELCASKT
ncbi:MAG: transposase [Okeania sp. SIO1H6]|uniref:Transposase n=1 Tax=Okeania hirsuta TaxID=1458930 RepID=A0A3N6RB40_9CYAN|nr:MULTISPECIES: zinc ribbon domain-containing protein [Okeania]NET12296.1 transposase [Okeania sp. SIO1H6]NES74535.1 transposase [Okeania sp. SIO1H4]NES92453.1 transposase [Okeania sp. SIO2B9]NET20860.1 transposase [Okeania sp. SIO1H5]NET74714.1 transposase [Okeania sp. SIO1F9]